MNGLTCKPNVKTGRTSVKFANLRPEVSKVIVMRVPTNVDERVIEISDS
jgi:hypothetical protein